MNLSRMVRSSRGISLKEVRVTPTQARKIKRTRVKTSLRWPPNRVAGGRGFGGKLGWGAQNRKLRWYTFNLKLLLFGEFYITFKLFCHIFT